MKSNFASRLAVVLVLVGCSSAPPSTEGPERSPASIDSPIERLADGKSSCVTVKTSGKSVRQDCTYVSEVTVLDGSGNPAKETRSRTIHVLTLDNGDFVQNSYMHGYLMAKEIEEGSLVEALANIEKVKKLLKLKDEALRLKVIDAVMAVYGCYEKKMMKSVSPEFMRGVRAIYKGYSDGMGGKPNFPEDQFVRATMSIEMGNFLGGLMESFNGGWRDKISTGMDVVADCGGAALKGYRKTYKATDIAALLRKQEVKEALREAGEEASTNETFKFGCTGVVATGGWTADHRLIHARNLEQSPMIHTWNRHPIVVINHDRSPDKRPRYKYVAFGTAGLIFPGGISGMNEKGISVSLHQMGTTAVDSTHKDGTAAMLPYMQQRMLAEASSIDEAIKIVERTKAFSSWTIFISDAFRNEVASIEITAKKFRVTRRTSGTYMGQANIYLHKDLQPLHFHGHYNNVLENVSRMHLVEDALKGRRGTMDLRKMINLLSDHGDHYEPGQERGYGRSIARISNIMTSIVVPRAGGLGGGEVWMTVADRMPPNQGHYAGFDVDFATMTAKPLGAIRSGSFTHRPFYDLSFERYQQAYVTNYDGGDPAVRMKYLEEAIALAARDGVNQPTYTYIRGRFKLNAGDAAAAYPVFKDLDRPEYRFHPLRRANISMYLMRAGDLLGGSYRMAPEERKRRYKEAKKVIADILDNERKNDAVYPYTAGYVHAKHDLEAKRKMWTKIYENEDKVIKLQDVDMSTVD